MWKCVDDKRKTDENEWMSRNKNIAPMGVPSAQWYVIRGVGGIIVDCRKWVKKCCRNVEL